MARKKLTTESDVKALSLGYPQCQWEAEGQRCRYPGSLSTGHLGEGPWYCGAHFGRSDPIAGADVVNASQDYVHGRDDDMPAILAGLGKRALLPREGEARAAYVARLRESMRGSSIGRHAPTHDWARKLIAKAEAGEFVYAVALQMALASEDRAEAKSTEEAMLG